MTDKLRDPLLAVMNLPTHRETLFGMAEGPALYEGQRLYLKRSEVLVELAAALAAAPQPAPAWNGPGEKPHTYSPDYQAMGDCRVCGHDYEAHQKAPQPAPVDREELVRLLQIITRNGSLDDGRTLHEAIADALLARGLRLPGDESMAWALVGDDEAVLADTVRWERGDVDAMFSDLGPSVRVAIRVVDGGNDAA